MGAVENEPTRYLLACVGGFIRSKINGVHWGKKEREYYFALFLSPAITTHYHFFSSPLSLSLHVALATCRYLSSDP